MPAKRFRLSMRVVISSGANVTASALSQQPPRFHRSFSSSFKAPYLCDGDVLLPHVPRRQPHAALELARQVEDLAWEGGAGCLFVG